MTPNDGKGPEADSLVRGHFRASPQVAEAALTKLLIRRFRVRPSGRAREPMRSMGKLYVA